MEYVLILLLVAVLLGPVLWLRPSPMDRRREQVRSRASSLGIHVRVCDLPQTRRQRVRREHPVLGAAYSLRAEDRAMAAERWLRAGSGGWETADGDTVTGGQQHWLDRIAAGLPAGVVALERSGQIATIYWDERGGEAAVEAVAVSLGRLSDKKPSGPPPV